MKPLSFIIPKSGPGRIHLQEDRSERFYDRLHVHPEIQITEILEGRGTLICGSYIGQFHPGDIYIIGSNLPHLFKSEQREAWSFSIFIEEKFILDSVFSQGDGNTGRNFLSDTLAGLKIRNEKKKNISDLLMACKGKDGVDLLIAFAQLMKELAERESYIMFSTPKMMHSVHEKDSQRLENVFHWITDNFLNDISLEDAAQQAAMSKSAFCRYFRQRTGKTFLNLVIEMRINHAAHLLHSTDLPVYDICFQSGFRNVSFFNRKFLEIKGVRPTKFRAVNRGVL